MIKNKAFEPSLATMLNTHSSEEPGMTFSEEDLKPSDVATEEIRSMKLYHWYSKLLAAYGDGDIIVMAESAEQARIKVYNQFDPLREGNPFEDAYLQMLELQDDEEFHEELQKLRDRLKADLDVQPMQPISDVVCIRGSD